MTRRRTPDPSPLAAPPGGPATVYAYLETPRGRDTPERVRALLVELDWKMIGAEAEPTDAQVHWSRLWLEDAELNDARATLASVRAKKLSARGLYLRRFVASR